MFENLQVFESRYEELNLKLYDPATAADRELYARLMKEHKEIEPIVETYRAWRQCGADLSGAKELLEEAADRELKEMAQQEIREKGIELSRLEEELKLLLLPKDPNDDKNVIVEIRGGAGGEEAALFANSLYRMYTMYAEAQGLEDRDCSTPTKRSWAALRRSAFLIDGEGAYSRLKYESGVHRVQRVPETETQGRIHTSTVTVAVLPEAEEVEVEINPERSADRHLPLQRRGRPAHQQDRLGHPHHPPAHRHGGGVPGRAEPVQKQGKGHESAAGPAVWSQAAGTGQRPGGRRSAAARWARGTAPSGSAPTTSPRAG